MHYFPADNVFVHGISIAQVVYKETQQIHSTIKIFFPTFTHSLFGIIQGSISTDIMLDKYEAMKSVHLKIYKTELYKCYTLTEVLF